MIQRQPPNEPQPARMWRFLDRALDGLATLCKLLTSIAIIVLTTIFGWLVFGRYVLNSTPTWVEQAALLLVMLIVFLGAAVGVHESTHLSVSALRSLLPGHWRRALVLSTDLLTAAFGFAMLWFGILLTAFKWDMRIPLIHLPEGLRSLPLAVGGGLIFLFAIGHLLRCLRGADRRGDPLG